LLVDHFGIPAPVERVMSDDRRRATPTQNPNQFAVRNRYGGQNQKVATAMECLTIMNRRLMAYWRTVLTTKDKAKALAMAKRTEPLRKVYRLARD
jgi:hypothetical protein